MAKFIERHDDLEMALNRGALWAVTYGDLMSYLMIFFLVLFVAQVSGSVKEQFGLHGIEETFGSENKRITAIFSEHGVQRIAKVDISQERVLAGNPRRTDSNPAARCRSPGSSSCRDMGRRGP
jgi:flagellar motor protein MotB